MVSPLIRPTILSVLSFALVVLSSIDVALEHYVEKAVTENGEDFSRQWPEGNSTLPIDLSPQHLVRGPTVAIKSAGAVGLTAGILCLVFGLILISRRRKGEQAFPQRWSLAALASSLLSILTAFIVTIYVFATESQNSTWAYSDQKSSNGHFTRESWVCQMKHQFWNPEERWMANTCMKAQVGKWLTIPLTTLALVLAGLVFWMNQRGSGRMLPRDVDLEVFEKRSMDSRQAPYEVV